MFVKHLNGKYPLHLKQQYVRSLIIVYLVNKNVTL